MGDDKQEKAAEEKPYEVTYPEPDPVPDLGEQGENPDEQAAKKADDKK